MSAVFPVLRFLLITIVRDHGRSLARTRTVTKTSMLVLRALLPVRSRLKALAVPSLPRPLLPVPALQCQ
jgi:hypothetical protein